jgi:hypothetical protein
MTGINASKIIQNLQILHSFAVPISSRAKESIRPPIFSSFSSLFLLSDSDFWNWVRCKPVGPAGERGRWESESLRVFNTRQESGNGTQKLRTGSRSVLQYGARIRDWVPLSPAKWGLFLLRLRQQRTAQRPGRRRHRARLSFTAGSALSARGCSHWATTWMNFRWRNQIEASVVILEGL